MVCPCMGPRCVLVVVLCLQMVAILERQVFDFLGQMWTSIAANFLQILFIIVGFFGVCQQRPRILTLYLIFSFVWIGWNAFVICLYLEVGVLDRDGPILNMGTGSISWWYSHGIGCQANNTYSSSDNQSTTVYVGCLLQYYYVEVIHAGVQCLLSIAGILASSCTLHAFRTEDCDSAQPVDDELEYIHMHNPPHERFAQKRDMAPSLSTVQLSDSSMEQRQSDDCLYRPPHRHEDVVRQGRGPTRLPAVASDCIYAWTPGRPEPSVSLTPQQSQLQSRVTRAEMSDSGPPCYEGFRQGAGDPTATFI